MAKAEKVQVNIGLKKATKLYIVRAAKKQNTTMASIVEEALTVHKAQHRSTV